jgi:5,10-methylenetetrahydromethanopterin reductase
VSTAPHTTKHVGVVLPRDLPAEQVIPFARRAEELGFDELWVVEDLGFKGGIAQAATVLAVTSRIHVGVGILPAAVRNAAFAAMEIATLAQIHPGRVIVGIGHGMPDWIRAIGAWPASPITLLTEYADALRALLRGAPGPPKGRYVNVEGVVLTELPGIVPPIVLGVRGPKSLAVAGSHADGVVLAEPATPEYIASARATAGLPDSARLISYDLAAVADDRAFALAAIRPALAVLMEADWLPHLVDSPYAEEVRALAHACTDPADFVRRLSEDCVAAFSLAGTPDDVRAKIAARHAAGSTSVVMFPTGEDPLAGLTGLSRALVS